MAISIAFFGLGIGGLLIYLIKNKIKTEKLPSKILQSSIAFAVSLPIFLFVIGHIIPPSTSFIYLFYLSSSIPFFLAGVSMALVYLAMPKEVTKLYFADLAGAAGATLILDPLLQRLGAESLILFIGILVVAPSVISAAAIRKYTSKSIADLAIIQKKSILYGLILVSISSALLAANLSSNILAIPPSENKGLHSMLSNPSSYKDLSTQWNSFSRIDVIQYNFTGADAVGSILIDADALTPILKWNGSSDNIQWLKRSMDYMPYEISNASSSNSSSTTALVIGSGGGEDILVALAAGSKNITAVEINPLIISAVKDFGGNLAGNLYDRNDIKLFIDDGRHFISSTTSKYDTIVIKLVDSWAAQLAGGYALSENYLYTVEAFKQYLSHLNGDNGKLVLVRWNTELPRLMPLVVESLRQQEVGKRSIQDISKQILVVEDRPGLTFGSNNQTTLYPVLVIIKNSPFTNSELNLVKERIARDGPKVIAMPGGYVQPPYDSLLISDDYIGGRDYGDQYQQKQQQQLQAGHDDPNTSSFRLKPPTDDSPFYFAKELIPQQLVSLIETAVGVSAVLALLLVYYSKLNRIKLTSSSRFHIMFVIFIGLGFIFLEITFIQKFLLLLGTPIMALTVILFSILLSGGIGAYLSGRLFNNNPYKAVVISIPILAAIVLAYYGFLPRIIDSSIILQLYQRIALTFALLSPVGLLMGFQFPSITRMSSTSAIQSPPPPPEEHRGNQDITLLWGVNVTASVLGTVITATTSMVIGFNGNLLIGFGLYLGALASAVAATKIAKQVGSQEVVK